MGSGILETGVFRAGLMTLCFAVIAGCNGTKDGQENQMPPNGGGSSNLTAPTINFSSATTSVTEGESVVVELTLSAAANAAITVPVTFTGTASGAMVDYSATATPLTVAAGSRSASITINARDDREDEPDETVILTLGTPTGANLGNTTAATVTLVDNDEPPPPGVSGRVTDASTGSGIQGVTVATGSATTTTDADGAYLLTGFTHTPSVVVSFGIEGYVPQSRTTDGLVTPTSHVVINVPMVAMSSAQTFDPTTPIDVTLAGSTARVVLAANSLTTVSGDPPAADVVAHVTPLAAAANLGVLPGNYGGGDAAPEPMETFGALNVQFTDDSGEPLVLGAGDTAVVNIPLSSRDAAPPSTVPLFYFDEVAGTWRQSGTASLQGTGTNRYYEGVVDRLGTWSAGRLYPSVEVSGCVADAGDTRIAGATVIAEGIDYTGTSQITTDSEGNFTVRVRANSEAFLQATRGEGISNSVEVATQSANIELTQCLVLTGNTLSIKLTWGQSPSDLDSHTLGANASDHIYYVDQGSLDDLPYVALDVDDTSGFGPEITTFTRLASNRTYSFYVHNYSGTFAPGQTGSPARVEITSAGVQTVFTPPAGESTETEYWHVFNLTTDESCNVTVVPVQQFTTAEPVNPNVGNEAAFCN